MSCPAFLLLTLLVCKEQYAMGYLNPHPDDRKSLFTSNLTCHETLDGRTVLRCSWIQENNLTVTSKKVICATNTVPFSEVDGDTYVQYIYYPENIEVGANDCHFIGPIVNTVDNVLMKTYQVYLSIMWSDGYPDWIQVTCYRPVAGQGNNFLESGDGSAKESGSDGSAEGSSSGNATAEGSGNGSGNGQATPEESGSGNATAEESGSGSDNATAEESGNGSGSGSSNATAEENGSGNATAKESESDRGNATAESTGLGDHVDVPGQDYTQSQIVNVNVGCNNTDDKVNASFSLLHIVTDLHLSAVAYCYNNTRIDFETKDMVNYYLKVYYDIPQYEDNGECVFREAVGVAYTVRVEVSWGERTDHVHTYTKDYMVSCIYDPSGDDFTLGNGPSGTSFVTPGLVNFKNVQGKTDYDLVSLIALSAVAVDGTPLEPQVSLGRSIMLKAVSNGGNGEVGLNPVSCDVIGVRSHERYAILRAGCGDGIILPKNKGFTINKLTTISPYFTTFAMSTDTRLRFECNFTLCTTTCDGSSCLYQRRKRSLNLP